MKFYLGLFSLSMLMAIGIMCKMSIDMFVLNQTFNGIVMFVLALYAIVVTVFTVLIFAEII